MHSLSPAYKATEPLHQLKNSIIFNLVCLCMCLKYESKCVYVLMNEYGDNWKTLGVLMSVCLTPLRQGLSLNLDLSV